MNNVIEYFIKAKDLTAATLNAAADRVKTFAAKVSGQMADVKKTSDMKPIEEKFVHTSRVLDMMGRAYENLGVKGRDFNDAMDVLERRLDNFNKTGKDSQQLFEHLKLSLEDFGASGKQVEQGLSMLKDNMIKVGDNADAVADTGIRGFNALRGATAALHGNFGMLAQQIGRCIPGLKELGTVGVSAFGAAIMSVGKFIGALNGLVRVAFNLDTLPKNLLEAKNQLHGLVEESKLFYENMNKERERSSELSQRYEETTRAINEATKAQNEFNRAQELALAKSDEQRKAINDKYNTLNAQSDERAAADLLGSQRKGLEDERKRLEAELARAQSDQDKFLKSARNATRKNRMTTSGTATDLAESALNFITFGGYRKSQDTKNALNEVSTNAFNAYDEAVEKEDEIRKKLEANAEQLKLLGIKEETQNTNSSAREKMDEAKKEEERQKKEEKERKEAEKAWQRELKDLNAEISREQRELDRARREEEKEALRQKREQEREAARKAKEEARELHRQKMADAHDEAEAAITLQRDAQDRLYIAKRKVSEAWGWYRDKDSLAAQIEEEKANAAAEKQFEKDFEKLKDRRRDWRTAKNLSLDDEAVRRVGLAREEEAAAKKALESIDNNVATIKQEIKQLKMAEN